MYLLPTSKDSGKEISRQQSWISILLTLSSFAPRLASFLASLLPFSRVPSFQFPLLFSIVPCIRSISHPPLFPFHPFLRSPNFLYPTLHLLLPFQLPLLSLSILFFSSLHSSNFLFSMLHLSLPFQLPLLSLSTPFLDAFLLRCIRQISHSLHFTSPFYSNYQCFFSILFLSSQYSLNFSFPTLHLSSSTLSFFRCIRPISPLHFSFFTPAPITTALSSFDVFFLSNFSSSHPFPSHFILFLRVLPLFLCSSYHRSLSISTPFFFLRRIPYATRQPPIFLSRADSCLQPVPRFICEFYSLCG